MAKKQEKVKVRCIECKHPELMQWDNNPVIAKCPFLLYRQVANSLRECDLFSKTMFKKEIKKYCEDNLSKYSWPYEYEYRDSIPTTLVGKVAYKKLEEENK